MLIAAMIFLAAGLGLVCIAVTDRNAAAAIFGAVSLLLAVDFAWAAVAVRREARHRAEWWRRNG